MRRFAVNFLLLLCCLCTAHSQSVYSLEQTPGTPPAVPRMIVFAGDTVRLTRPDIRERLDRELIAFTYSHSASLLMLKRSRRIFEQIVPILQLHGIPEDLKYLMAIESNLDPRALSPAGAAGLWQFMKASGREYGLVIDEEVDERYNIEKATEAACAYLKTAYSKFGSWMNVAAGYNGGMAGLAKKLSDQKQDDAMDLWMVEETSRYMYRVLVAKMFFENPSSFGFTISPADYYPSLKVKERLTLAEGIPSLVDFAIAHGTSYKRLKEANLWLRDNKLVNKAQRTYTILIPEE
ncbi:MAG: lytic transglycosylase domain-containing protein [Bacteroidales bacterium]|nr:lytic transglycosylase domain-containing protein [Bacteroidales bacterium]